MAATRLIALIGRPSGPWSSAAVYNTAFRAIGLDWRCVRLPVPAARLQEALLGLRALGFAGAELAEPYRQRALELVEEATPAAETIGAAKFVFLDEGGRLVGDTLLWLAFLDTLYGLVPSTRGLRALILGAEGRAADIVYALTREGVPLTILDENVSGAINLVHRLRHARAEHDFSVYRWPQDLGRVVRGANLIVYTTALAEFVSGPNADGSPWPSGLPFPSGALVFDFTTWSTESRFLSQARAGGAMTVGAVPISVREAALAVARWTGQLVNPH